MNADVVVQIRPSSQAPGQREQAVYFLDGITAPPTKSTWSYQNVGALDAYSTQYTMVMVAGGAGTWLSDWQSYPRDANGDTLTDLSGGTYNPQWSKFVGSELPAYLNENFSVDKTGNAIVGLSMSGGSAVNIALTYPDVFKVVDSVSGYYQTNNPIGYFLIPFIQSYTAGIENGYTAMWGDPMGPNNTWSQNDVSQRIAAIKSSGQTVIISAGIGIPSASEFALMMSQGGLSNVMLGMGLELGSFVSTVILNVQAIAYDLPIQFKYTLGAHDWIHWENNLPSEAALVQGGLTKYAVTVPASSVVGQSATATAPVTAAPSDVPSAVDDSTGVATASSAVADTGAPVATAANTQAPADVVAPPVTPTDAGESPAPAASAPAVTEDAKAPLVTTPAPSVTTPAPSPTTTPAQSVTTPGAGGPTTNAPDDVNAGATVSAVGDSSASTQKTPADTAKSG